MRTGNLQEIDKPLAYFLLNPNGDVHLVGILLDKNVEKELKKSFKKLSTNEY